MRRPPPTAMQSSRRAAGRFLPKALARAPRTAGAAEGSDDCAYGTGAEAGNEGVVGEAEGGSGECAHDDAGAELGWDLAARGVGELVVDDLAEGARRRECRR